MSRQRFHFPFLKLKDGTVIHSFRGTDIFVNSSLFSYVWIFVRIGKRLATREMSKTNIIV